MRDIKFRGWHEPSKSMVSPDGHFIEFDGSIWFNCGDYHDQLTSQEDVILMQFTGLQDRNGKDIYEGDIARWRGYSPATAKIGTYTVPVRNEDCAAFYDFGGQDDFCSLSEAHWVEVIGNIHENPELLEQS